MQKYLYIVSYKLIKKWASDVWDKILKGSNDMILDDNDILESNDYLSEDE